MENEISKLIDTLCDRELIVRFNLNKTLKISTFKIGTMELQGEFGVSFRNIEIVKKLEELEKEGKSKVDVEMEMKKEGIEEEKKDKGGKIVVE